MEIKPVYYLTDKQKLKMFNNTHHEQVIIEGERPNGNRYKLICDKGIVDLIRKLNDNGVRTAWSCEGAKDVAYLVINPYKLSKSRLLWADHYIRKYWHDRYIAVDIGTRDANICYYAFTKRGVLKSSKDRFLSCYDDDYKEK